MLCPAPAIPIFLACRKSNSRPTSRSASRSRPVTRAAGSRGSGRWSMRSSPAHDYPPAIERLLAEALTLTALLGSLLKEPQGQLTLQAQTGGGIVDLLVCDYLGGELRGYVRHDPERLAAAVGRAVAEGAVRRGLSGDHLRSADRRRALSGHRAAGGPEPRRGGAELFRPVGADPEPGPARGGEAQRAIGPRAGCCFSICPKARKAATGCIRASTIPTGRMSRSSADR